MKIVKNVQLRTGWSRLLFRISRHDLQPWPRPDSPRSAGPIPFTHFLNAGCCAPASAASRVLSDYGDCVRVRWPAGPKRDGHARDDGDATNWWSDPQEVFAGILVEVRVGHP